MKKDAVLAALGNMLNEAVSLIGAKTLLGVASLLLTIAAILLLLVVGIWAAKGAYAIWQKRQAAAQARHEANPPVRVWCGFPGPAALGEYQDQPAEVSFDPLEERPRTIIISPEDEIVLDDPTPPAVEPRPEPGRTTTLRGFGAIVIKEE